MTSILSHLSQCFPPSFQKASLSGSLKVGAGHWLDPWAQPIFFLRIDDSHSDRIHSFLTAVYCFENGYVGKQQVAWKEYCVEYWLKELKESMERCTGCHNIHKTLLKTSLNTIQSINGFKLGLCGKGFNFYQAIRYSTFNFVGCSVLSFLTP